MKSNVMAQTGARCDGSGVRIIEQSYALSPPTEKQPNTLKEAKHVTAHTPDKSPTTKPKNPDPSTVSTIPLTKNPKRPNRAEHHFTPTTSDEETRPAEIKRLNFRFICREGRDYRPGILEEEVEDGCTFRCPVDLDENEVVIGRVR